MCVVNPIVSKMSDIIYKKKKVFEIKVSNLSVFNYCDTLSPMCFTNMYIVFFRHPGYIYGVQRATRR